MVHSPPIVLGQFEIKVATISTHSVARRACKNAGIVYFPWPTNVDINKEAKEFNSNLHQNKMITFSIVDCNSWIHSPSVAG